MLKVKGCVNTRNSACLRRPMLERRGRSRMKISGANISATEAARVYQAQAGGLAKLQRGGTSRRFDSITLSGGDGTRGSFEMELRGKISQEVRTATSSGQIAALREQVQNGTYQVDTRAIAQKMLLMEAV